MIAWPWTRRFWSTLDGRTYQLLMHARPWLGRPPGGRVRGPGAGVAGLPAVVGIVCLLYVPIIHLSVLWWRTLHPQPVVMIMDDPGGGLPASMLVTLLVALI